MAKHTVKEIPFWDGIELHQPGAVVDYNGKPSDNLVPVVDEKPAGKKGAKADPEDNLA